MNKLDSIDHIAVTVANLEAAVNWYLSSFNCEVVHQGAHFAHLQFANVKLALVLPSSQPTHVAYLKNDAETLGELRRSTDGFDSTFIADSTGNIVELIKI